MLHSLEYKPYVAIIGDIIKSKSIKERKNVQEKLYQVLMKLNEKYQNDIAANFIITLGDEFQGLLHEGENVLPIIEYIQMEMHPVEIRFGIGVGEITTDIVREMAIGADGPGYYMARRAIEYLKRCESKSKTYTADIRIEIEEDEEMISSMLNTIFSLQTVIKRSWTQRQREIIREYEKNKGSQIECARSLGIAQSSVQRSLDNGNYYAYKNAAETINNILKKIGEENV